MWGLSHGGSLVVRGTPKLPHDTVVYPHFPHFCVPSQMTHLEKTRRNNEETVERWCRDNVEGKMAVIPHSKHGEASM